MKETDALLLRGFAENDMNATRAADALYLHRNTLLYRLDRIKRETGLDPRKFYDLAKLLGMDEKKSRRTNPPTPDTAPSSR